MIGLASRFVGSGWCSTERPGRDASLTLARGLRAHRRPGAVSATRSERGRRPPRSGVSPSTKASTVGPAPEITAGTPRARRSCDQGERLRHRRLALLLVQEVLGGAQQQSRAVRRARPRAARRDRCWRRRPRAGTDVGQQAARDLGAHAVRRHEHDRGDRRRRPGDCWAQTVVAGLAGRSRTRRAAPARRCRGGPRAGWPASSACPSSSSAAPSATRRARQHDAADDRGRGRAQPPAVRDPVRAGQAQPGRLLAHRLEGRPHRADHEVASRRGTTSARPRPRRRTSRPVVDDLADQRVGQLERQPEAVEARARGWRWWPGPRR